MFEEIRYIIKTISDASLFHYKSCTKCIFLLLSVRVCSFSWIKVLAFIVPSWQNMNHLKAIKAEISGHPNKTSRPLKIGQILSHLLNFKNEVISGKVFNFKMEILKSQRICKIPHIYAWESARQIKSDKMHHTGWYKAPELLHLHFLS